MQQLLKEYIKETLIEKIETNNHMNDDISNLFSKFIRKYKLSYFKYIKQMYPNIDVIPIKMFIKDINKYMICISIKFQQKLFSRRQYREYSDTILMLSQNDDIYVANDSTLQNAEHIPINRGVFNTLTLPSNSYRHLDYFVSNKYAYKISYQELFAIVEIAKSYNDFIFLLERFKH